MSKIPGHMDSKEFFKSMMGMDGFLSHLDISLNSAEEGNVSIRLEFNDKIKRPDYIRYLRDAGANIIPVMSKSALSLITRTTMEWASGREVIQELTGKMEHISLFEGNAHNTIMVVCPATYNEIGKFANGISDGPIEAMFAYALGHGNPILIVPAMHLDMYANPVAKENISKLKSLGISVMEPIMENNKAKLQDPAEICDSIIRAFNRENKKSILIVSGKSEVPIDPVRSITNKSSGLTGYWFARWAYRLGFSRITFIGNSEYHIPSYASTITCNENDGFYTATKEELKKMKYDIIILCAALSDFNVKKSGVKLDSSSKQNLQLEPVEKLRDIAKKASKGDIITFKLAHRGEKPLSNDGFITIHNYIEDNIIGKNSGNYAVTGIGDEMSLPGMEKSDLAFTILGKLLGRKP